MRRAILFLVPIALSCAEPRRISAPELVLTPIAPAPEHVPPANTAKVVVTLVIDQMAGWIAEERWPLLPKSGGFARLAREGTRASDMRYAHAVTDTAPGHSSLYTGAVPRDSGIFANEIPGDEPGTAASILRDADATLVTPSGKGGAGSSARVLKVETLADRLRRTHPDAFIVSLSLKDRGAIFGGGAKPTASLWYRPEGKAFVTSVAFDDKLPAWAMGVAQRPLSMAPPEWELLDPPWVKAHAKSPDAQDGEGDYHGLGTLFPHPVTTAKEPELAFRATPFGDRAIFALAEAALGDSQAVGKPTLLALSLSANDYIGHTFGPDSWEAWDELFRLDTALGRFLGVLDQKYGADGYAVVLSADHGVAPMPEIVSQPWCAAGAVDRWGRTCHGARLFPAALAEELKRVAAQTAGRGEWVRDVVDPYVYLTSNARALPEAQRKKLDRALVDALVQHKEVAEVIDVRTLPATCPAAEVESVSALVCRSYVPHGSAGDFYIVPQPGCFFDPTVVVGKGTSHGTPYLYDRSVPLLVRAPGRVAAGVVKNEPIGFGAFARTASALLEIDPPAAAARATDLTEQKPRSPR